MTEIAIAIIGSGIITKLLDVLLDAIKTKKNPIRVGIRLCLFNDMDNYGKKLLAKGNVTQTEINTFNEMYETYKALGGDGYADKLKSEIDNLALKVVA